MSEFVSRVEFEDLIRHLTTKLDSTLSRVRELSERVEVLEVVATGNGFSIRLLGRLLQSLLPEEQRELLAIEQRAGVTDSGDVDQGEREPNDGNEWRQRLRDRAAFMSEKLRQPPCPPPPPTAAQVDAMKSLGSLFNVDPQLDGPYARHNDLPPSML